MRRVIMICDRCKKEFEKWNYNRNEVIGVGEIVYGFGDTHIDIQKDLCEACYIDLEKWWNFDSQVEENKVKIQKDFPSLSSYLIEQLRRGEE